MDIAGGVVIDALSTLLLLGLLTMTLVVVVGVYAETSLLPWLLTLLWGGLHQWCWWWWSVSTLVVIIVLAVDVIGRMVVNLLSMVGSLLMVSVERWSGGHHRQCCCWCWLVSTLVVIIILAITIDTVTGGGVHCKICQTNCSIPSVEIQISCLWCLLLHEIRCIP